MAGGVYHVFARGNRRQPIFLGDEDRRRYLAIWGAVATDLEWRCLAYCLMDNHVHHLVETPNPDLSRGVQLAHSTYSRRFNAEHGKSGHLFQGRFGSTLARAPDAVWSLASYIALNPTRAEMCERPEQYVWSSHAAALGAAPGPRWLDTQRLLSFYDPTPGAKALELYERIVEALRLMGAPGHGANAPTSPPHAR